MKKRNSIALGLAMVAAAASAATTTLPAAAQARSRAPHISSVRCWPPSSCWRTDSHAVAPGGRLRFRGSHLSGRGMYVVFNGGARSSAGGARRAPIARLRYSRRNGFVATVPLNARTGRVRIVTRSGLRSNLTGLIRIRKRYATAPKGTGTAFDGNGMWIWYVSRSSGGTAAGIVAQAQQYGVNTVFIKSSDGSSWWSQFSSALVSQLKGAGLHVCAWQYVYGKNPAAEASLGARAAQTGADCLVIDAESEYQGLYSQAQTYMQDLRAAVGPSYPVGLASFPYVDYHPSLPYSVFLGPGGAQYNVPQVYWKAIGVSPDTALAHTYLWNSVYGRRIFPLGQLYDGPSTSDVNRFRALASGYGASGVSWWSWQAASSSGWAAIAPPSPAPIVPPAPGYPLLKSGSKGDVVVWAQEHLMTAGQQLSPDGIYGASTAQAVSSFQSANGLPVTGQVDAATWPALLKLQPAPVSWNGTAARASTAGAHRNGPRSAFLGAKRYEIPRTPPR